MQPALSDLERLEAHFQSAMSARKDIRWSGLLVEYPEPVSALMLYLAEPPWCDFDYDPCDTERILGRMATADMAEVRSVLTAMFRCERFCDGGWEGALGDGTLASAVARARELVTT